MQDIEKMAEQMPMQTEEATEAEEVQLGKVLASAMKFFNDKGKGQLLKVVENGTDVAQAMGTFTYTTLKGIYDKAKASGDDIPMSVFMGENGAVEQLMNMEAKWLIANGYEEAGQPETIQKAMTLMMTMYGSEMEKTGQVDKGKYKQELAEAMEDPNVMSVGKYMMGQSSKEESPVKGQGALGGAV